MLGGLEDGTKKQMSYEARAKRPQGRFVRTKTFRCWCYGNEEVGIQ